MSKYTPFNTVDDYKIKLQEAKITLGFSPTADVVEVRHGEWHSYVGYCECTLCHHKYVNTSLYCPNCGARMSGERRENGK